MNIKKIRYINEKNKRLQIYMNADLAKSNRGFESVTSCVKSENVVITATTPIPLAVQF